MARRAPHRGRRFTLGALATLLGSGVALLGQLLLVPVLLAFWGADRFGEWLALSAAAGYLVILDLGLTSYLGNRLNALYARGDLEAYHRILGGALAFLLLLALAGLALALALLLADAPRGWLDLRVLDERTTLAVGLLLAAQFLGGLPQGLLREVYRTTGHYARGTLIANAERAAWFAVTAAIVALGGGVVEAAAGQLAVTALTAAYLVRDIGARRPRIRLRVVPGRALSTLKLVPNSAPFLAFDAAMATTVQGTALVVAAAASSAELALFVATRTLSHLIRHLGAAVHHALWPELTTLAAEERTRTLAELHRLAIKGSTLVSLSAALWLHGSAELVFGAWTRGALPFDRTLLTAFLVLLVLQAPWMASMYLLVATNHLRATARCQLGASLAGVALAAATVERFGLPAVVVCLGIAELCLSGWLLPRAACRVVGESPRTLLRLARRGALVCAGALVLALGLIATVEGLPTWPRLLAITLIVPPVTLVVGWFGWLSPAERARLRGAVRALADPGG